MYYNLVKRIQISITKDWYLDNWPTYVFKTIPEAALFKRNTFIQQPRHCNLFIYEFTRKAQIQNGSQYKEIKLSSFKLDVPKYRIGNYWKSAKFCGWGIAPGEIELSGATPVNSLRQV